METDGLPSATLADGSFCYGIHRRIALFRSSFIGFNLILLFPDRWLQLPSWCADELLNPHGC
ncbi:hypothetical protein SynA1560_02235 [Synechococcus sp. A15-60]|nr:hypothetical protein SynA1560_02235 [Synechococcus sp. A15-60]